MSGHFDSYSAGIDFRRQKMTSKYVIFWRLKSISALEKLSIADGRKPIA